MDILLGLVFFVATVNVAHVKGLTSKDTYINQVENSQNKKRFVFSSNLNSNININTNTNVNVNNNNNNNNNNNMNININYNSAIVTQVTMVQSSGPLCTLPNGAQLFFGRTATGADSCTKMTCTATGIISSSRSCNHHQPSQHVGCSYGGQYYHLGDTFNHTDGCNKCVCGTNSIQCTNVKACKQNADCTYHGVGYSMGQSFSHPDGCNVCQCTIMGVMCTNNPCTTTTTTTAAPFACEWYGRFYHNGDTMPGDGCHTCTCFQGQALCSASLNCPVSG